VGVADAGYQGAGLAIPYHKPAHNNTLRAWEDDLNRVTRHPPNRTCLPHEHVVEALTDRFGAHHYPPTTLARILLVQRDGLTAQIDQLTNWIDQALGAVPPPGQSGHRPPQHRRTDMYLDKRDWSTR